MASFKILVILVVATLGTVSTDIINDDKLSGSALAIDGPQSTEELKDINGIVRSEIGFITADGIYHVSVYATDEKGLFHVISTKNIRLGDMSSSTSSHNHHLEPRSIEYSQENPCDGANPPTPTTTTPKPRPRPRPITTPKPITKPPTHRPRPPPQDPCDDDTSGIELPESHGPFHKVMQPTHINVVPDTYVGGPSCAGCNTGASLQNRRKRDSPCDCQETSHNHHIESRSIEFAQKSPCGRASPPTTTTPRPRVPPPKRPCDGGARGPQPPIHAVKNPNQNSYPNPNQNSNPNPNALHIDAEPDNFVPGPSCAGCNTGNSLKRRRKRNSPCSCPCNCPSTKVDLPHPPPALPQKQPSTTPYTPNTYLPPKPPCKYRKTQPPTTPAPITTPITRRLTTTTPAPITTPITRRLTMPAPPPLKPRTYAPPHPPKTPCETGIPQPPIPNYPSVPSGPYIPSPPSPPSRPHIPSPPSPPSRSHIPSPPSPPSRSHIPSPPSVGSLHIEAIPDNFVPGPSCATCNTGATLQLRRKREIAFDEFKDSLSLDDKYLNMKEGLPEGVTEADIVDLLYKLNNTVGFHYENGYTDGSKIGGYFVKGRDGISVVITYIADKKGYHPKIKLLNLEHGSKDVAVAEKQKRFGLKNFEFTWYPAN